MDQRFQPNKRHRIIQTGLLAAALTLLLTACAEPIVEPTATATPEPTMTPTKTPTPEPTATYTPTPKSTSTASPTLAPGLGVTRADLQEGYEALGFIFTPPHEGLYGTEVVGEIQDIVKTMVFIDGPAENVLVVWVTVFMPTEPTEDQLYRGLDHMAALLDNSIPDWAGGIDWLLANLPELEIGEEITTVQDGRLVSMSFWPGVEDEIVFMVQIEVQQ